MAPIEAKVKGATGGSTAGVALAGLILWLLDTYVFRDQPVPDPIVVAVWTLLPIGLTFLGGYLAKHTSRPAAASAPPSSHVHRVGSHAADPAGEPERLHRPFGGIAPPD